MKKALFFLMVFLGFSSELFAQNPELESLRLIIPIGHSDEIGEIRISPNGKLVATANIEWTYEGSIGDGATDRNVLIWNNRGIPLHVLAHENTVLYMSDISFNDSLILTFDGQIHLWDLTNGQEVFQFMPKNQFDGILDYYYKQNINFFPHSKDFYYYYGTGINTVHLNNLSSFKNSFSDTVLLVFDPEEPFQIYRSENMDSLKVITIGTTYSWQNGKFFQSKNTPKADSILIASDGYFEENSTNNHLLVSPKDYNLEFFDRELKQLFYSNNRSVNIDFVDFNRPSNEFTYEANGHLNCVDLSTLQSKGYKFTNDYTYKHLLWMDTNLFVFDYGAWANIGIMDVKDSIELKFDPITIPLTVKNMLIENSIEPNQPLSIGTLLSLTTTWLMDKFPSFDSISVMNGMYKINGFGFPLSFRRKGDLLYLTDSSFYVNDAETDNLESSDSIAVYDPGQEEIEEMAPRFPRLLKTSDYDSQIDYIVQQTQEKKVRISQSKSIDTIELSLSSLMNNRYNQQKTGTNKNPNPVECWILEKKGLIAINEINEIEFFNMNGWPLWRFIPIGNNDFMILLPDGHYTLSHPTIAKELHYFKSNSELLHFDQLDPIYNRPDIVLDSVGKYFGGADQQLISQYREAWEKRMDRLGLDKLRIGKGDFSVPNAKIEIVSDRIESNQESDLQLKVVANDPKYKLMSFNVYVNEVPLYSSKGISIAALNVKNWDSTITVPLSVGDNKIQVSVMNELGLENFKYPIYVSFVPNQEIVAKTYYIGIGVNEFLDQTHNLKYCVSDVRDLSVELTKQNNVDTILLVNKQVTKENILNLKKILEKTSVNDCVIISCSSHGLLDEKNNFYLAMHNTDFSNPKVNGLPYEELEGILDSIPARRKLLLLDACNSGENEQIEANKLLVSEQVTQQEQLDTRGVRVIAKNAASTKSSFETMMELFVNIQNETGSVIISAAGGQQSALEAIEVNNKKIENGAFTYCILEYLKNNENQPEKLTVNQLKAYVEKRVQEITHGQQKPTSRQETMEVDWRLK